MSVWTEHRSNWLFVESLVQRSSSLARVELFRASGGGLRPRRELCASSSGIPQGQLSPAAYQFQHPFRCVQKSTRHSLPLGARSNFIACWGEEGFRMPHSSLSLRLPCLGDV